MIATTIHQALEVQHTAHLILENNETIEATKAIELAEKIHQAQDEDRFEEVFRLLRVARKRL